VAALTLQTSPPQARAGDKVLVASHAVQRGEAEDKYLPSVREVLAAPDFARKVQPGARYRLTSGGSNAFNFTADGQQIIYMVITLAEYPERLVFQMINELVVRFSDLAPAAKTCAAGGLDSKARKIFSQLAWQYDDPTQVDKLSVVQEQVYGVQKQMAQNVDQMIRNIDTASNIETKSRDLQESAQLFNRTSVALKRAELCRKYKITACLVLAVVVLILVIVLSLFGPQIATAAAAPSPGTSPTAPPTFPPTSPAG
jgi:hypothetical protein